MILLPILILTHASAFCAPAHGDGRLSLYYDARKEALDIIFRDSRGTAIPSAIQKINFFLRSPDNKNCDIDMRLLDLADVIQDHFDEPVIEIISACRSPEYNRGLKETGHAVANESLHIKGQAMDIHLDTVTEEAVRNYARSLSRGGVGWYPEHDFIHVDLGPVRTWGHAEKKRKWVGLQDPLNHFVIRSNTNRYFYHEAALFTIRPGPTTGMYEEDVSKILAPDPGPTDALERFDRGKWKAVYTEVKTETDATVRIPAFILDLLARGRYRLRLGGSLSNEFYLKN